MTTYNVAHHLSFQNKITPSNMATMSRNTESDEATDEIDITRNGREHQTEYMNNAARVLKLRIDTTASGAERRGQVEKIVGVLCPFLLRNSEGDSLQIKSLTGGLSNHLLLVSNSTFPGDADDTATTIENTLPNAVLVRIYPDEGSRDIDTEAKDCFSMIDRELETKFVSWLASQREDLQHNRGSMAPTVYGCFENGRIEEFYSNVRPLAWAEMKIYAPLIAQSLASFHSLKSPPEDVLPPPPSSCISDASIFRTIRAWLEEANNTNTSNSALLEQVCREWDWLENSLANPPQQRSIEGTNSPIVAEALEFIRRMAITHMDCQPLNILINKEVAEEGRNDTGHSPTMLRLIDFEYSGWNPVAADIANTFCEYCEMSNLRADYDKEYPTPAQQDTFFWHYLLQSNPVRAKQFSSYLMRKEGSNYDYVTGCDREWYLFSTTLQQEVGRFSLLSHLGWTIWSIIKAQEEDGVEFDYMAYARHRMDGYAWAKNKFFDI